MFINISIYSDINRLKVLFLITVLMLYCLINNTLMAENVLENKGFVENYCLPSIKSVKAYRTGRDLNNPIVELNSDETITVEFDDLSDEGSSYDYTFIHCTYSWQPSDLIYMDYCNGFEYNRVDNYRNSMGTMQPYIHYSLSFPNDQVSFKISGNYILKVVDSYDHDKVVLLQRFMVVEPVLSMNAKIRQSLDPSLTFTSQQMELEVDVKPLGSIDPDHDIVTVVCQNGQTDNQLVGIKSTYIYQNKIRYTSPECLIFDGCNEYRNINIKSYSYQTPKIVRIENYGAEMHVRLSPDFNNFRQDYSENPDLDGKYIVKRDDSNDSNVEADYAWVYFTLNIPELENSDVYVYGEFTGWTINPDYKLTYNHQSNSYELKALLKQGYYNYRYVVVDGASGIVSHSRLEGNHYSTENTYQVTVYYKSPSVRYWRLVGIKTISSRFAVN